MFMTRGKQLMIVLPLILLGGLGFVLPTADSPVLASPDETAVFIASSRMSDWQPAVIAEPLAEEFPWLHPRSWISHGQYIVPVGFLGWPWLLSFFGIFGEKLPMFIATLLILSSAYPLYRLLLPFGRRGAFWGTAVYLTFPPFILYANRSLFANGAVVAGFLWSLLLLKVLGERTLPDKKRHALILTTGLVIGLTIAVRPVEALWMAPWFIWAGWNISYTKKHAAWFIGGLALVALPLMFQALLVYGSPMLSGYLLSDNPLPYEVRSELVQPEPEREIFDRFLPYGLHPKNIWWNIRSFFFGYLWAWMIPLVGFFALYYKKIKRPRSWKEVFHPLWLSLWTAGVLLVIYGSGIYFDHVRVGAITLGNSFLRYLLPIVIAISVAVAYLWQAAEGKTKYVAALTVLCVGLGGFGGYKALSADDESLLATRPELERYVEVRAAADEWFDEKDVILSERSDKIFFPDFRAVSPLPPESEIGRLVNETDLSIGLYTRPLSQKDKDTWRKYGVDVIELGSFAREKLYLLKPGS